MPGMEPRSITLLTTDGDLPLAARVTERDGRRLTLHVDKHLEREAAIRIDVDDQVLLGEVLWCARTGTGYSAEVELDQAITSVHDLSRLVDALMRQDRRRAAHPEETCKPATLP